jgi:hypothetical protein
MGDEAAPPPPPPRSLRVGYAVVQSATVALVVTLCWIARGFERVYDQLDLKALPAPTELFLAAARFVRTPAGSIAVGLLGGGLVVMGLRGTFDRWLRKLIAGNVVGGALLLAFYVLSLYIPILRIQDALKDR